MRPDPAQVEASPTAQFGSARTPSYVLVATNRRHMAAERAVESTVLLSFESLNAIRRPSLPIVFGALAPGLTTLQVRVGWGRRWA